MASAALRRVGASFLPLPAGRPGIAAALIAGAAAAWAPTAFAEPLKQATHDEVAPSQEGGATGGALGHHRCPAVGDGLDEVRQRIRQYGLRPEEEKLISLLRELQADERRYLKWFEEAEAKGDDKMMRIYHSDWQSTTEKTELLKADPRKFVRKHGYLYDITVKTSWFPFL